GLWALAFDPNAPGTTDTGALYFTAGPNMGNDGIFGKIDAVPEPGTWALAVLGVLGAMSFRRAVKREGQR
ncbi:MAG: PEP-CTERM sorting domain-containing protein, partial [Acidobacteriaceae bacterium]|nr:PEP-CTERM sorting domain-containing protein [Acidobacteriaceae bacterium]